MVKQGHFHAHIKSVSRSKGYSAVAAAAYQSGQDLIHEKQHLFSVDLGYDKDKGGVTADHRKRLNKGIVTDDLRREFAAGGVTLHEGATAQKHDRSNWTIIDGGMVYTVKEYRHRVLNRETRKREDAAIKLDIYADRTHNYTTREDVRETWVQAPSHAPEWIRTIEAKGGAVEKKDRERLWNWAESTEIARDARTARTFQLALSRGLSYEQNLGLLREYVNEQLTPHGYVSDVAIHSKKASDGKENLHAHILITTRSLNLDGTLAANKTAPWDDHEKVADRHKAWGSQLKAWRAAWAEKQNSALEATESDTRVDHRSYQEQGVDVIPTEHVGAAEWNKGKRGEKTQAAERNEAIENQNIKKDRHYNTLEDRARVRRPKANREQTGEKSTEKQYYAGRTTVTRWFGLGSKTTHIYLPGMSSLPRKQRDALDKSTPRLTPSEVQERLSEHHERTIAGFLANNQSGGSPQKSIEHLQRIAKTVRQKTSDAGNYVGESLKSWRERIANQRQNQQSDKNEHDR